MSTIEIQWDFLTFETLFLKLEADLECTLIFCDSQKFKTFVLFAFVQIFLLCIFARN